MLLSLELQLYYFGHEVEFSVNLLLDHNLVAHSVEMEVGEEDRSF